MLRRNPLGPREVRWQGPWVGTRLLEAGHSKVRSGKLLVSAHAVAQMLLRLLGILAASSG